MASDKMRQALDQLRPWADEVAVARALREWMQTELYKREPGSKDRVPLRLGEEIERDAAVKIAAELRDFGRWQSSATGDDALGVAGFMLRNVLARREANENDSFDYIIGAPSPRTRRRYRATFGADGGWAWMRESLQQDLDVAALVRAGRTPAAARRWLERHPGLHAKDAPPPRKRRAA